MERERRLLLVCGQQKMGGEKIVGRGQARRIGSRFVRAPSSGPHASCRGAGRRASPRGTSAAMASPTASAAPRRLAFRAVALVACARVCCSSLFRNAATSGVGCDTWQLGLPELTLNASADLLENDMFADIFAVVYKHAQNFGKENTLSAILAAIFEFSPNALLAIMDAAGVRVESPARRIPNSQPLSVETGVTYFCAADSTTEEFRFRPDVLAYAGHSFESRGLSEFILFESKLASPLTPRQLQGYPQLREEHGSNLLLLLVSNSPTKADADVFDACLSWREVAYALSMYVEERCKNGTEQLIVKELLTSLNGVGNEFKTFLFRDAVPSPPAQDGLSTKEFVKLMRRRAGLTQAEFARSVGVGLRFIRDLEQGKVTVRTDKVNDVLAFFGCELGPIRGSEAQRATDQSPPEISAIRKL
jgi:y4mF family transcriptional regulator